MRDYGSVDKQHLTFERHFTVPPERIWSALTDAGELERWLGVAELELKVGGNLVVRFAHVKGAEMHGVFTRVEPPHLLEHTWRESGAESLVRWEIERDEEGHTNLTFKRISLRWSGADIVAGCMLDWLRLYTFAMSSGCCCTNAKALRYFGAEWRGNKVRSFTPWARQLRLAKSLYNHAI